MANKIMTNIFKDNYGNGTDSAKDKDNTDTEIDSNSLMLWYSYFVETLFS